MQMNRVGPRAAGMGLRVAGAGIAGMIFLAAHLGAQSWTASGSNIYFTGGNVGIGTTTPSIPLQVSGAMGPTSTENLSASSGQLILNSSSGIAMKAGTNTVATVTSSSGNSILTLSAGDFPRLNFGTSGNTFIGRSSGPTWLDIINSSGAISLHAGSTYIAATGNGFLAQNNSFIGAGDNSTGYRMFGVTWSRSGGGNGQAAMGISTLAAPYAGGNLLLVAGGNESGAYAHASQSDPTLIIHSRAAAATATNQWLSLQHNTSDGVIQTGTGSLILNPASGYVGIGTSAPCAGSTANCRLAVKGAIRANEVVVDSGWSDYVFDEGYRTEPLSEVERYIAENHHLPDIPSAQEVAEKGVSLGEMQAKLLAKIEELTLHMIESDKRSVRLERENSELRRDIDALKDGEPAMKSRGLKGTATDNPERHGERIGRQRFCSVFRTDHVAERKQ